MPTHNSIIKDVGEYYAQKLAEHGATPKGVDWNSAESQELRFAQLAKLLPCEATQTFSVAEIGCGYGSLFPYLKRTWAGVEYLGYDIAPTMVDTARRLHQNEPNCRFSADAGELEVCDYTVASGIFNVRLGHEPAAWERYIEDVIDQMHRLSRKGFAFNLLTLYSDPDRRRPDLYYGSPTHYFDHCARRYSRHVAVLQDYGLYEFTVLARKLS